jgi:lipopolysaccharide transport system ATP-binding protein
MSVDSTPFAVRVSGISKLYQIGGLPGQVTLYERIARAVPGRRHVAPVPHPTVWALKDVTFEVPHGHVLGVVGRNGSGKSTLMRILARVTVPTEGTAEIYGRVAALLEVGTGFHPELSGRDNIALSGAIKGMRREEIAAAQEQIIEFAEIGRFLDTAVKHYSSGMFLRLAFSVSVHLAAEIMLVDEVLAVGDAGFRKKCEERIRAIVREGRSVLFVSHASDSIRTLCDSAIVLDGGVVRFNGPTDEAMRFNEGEIIPKGRPRGM